MKHLISNYELLNVLQNIIKPLGMLMALFAEEVVFKVSTPDEPSPLTHGLTDVDDISGVEVRLSFILRSFIVLVRGSPPALLVADESTISLLFVLPILGEDGLGVVDGDDDDTDVGEVDDEAVVELKT